MTTNKQDQVTTATYLCIGCPLGCRLEVDENEAGDIVEVRGFSCKRGDVYARQEHVAPKRTVTTTVQVRNGFYPRLPVKTDRPVPKEMVMAICRRLHQAEVVAPIKMGDVILPDVLQLGANVVATRDMNAT